ncbi:uncharacterized protein LOC142774216 [Rhipicephalus microplus]|uniref:uncharacterized protein LOC142774216 n=1 Tax=Rhipicephalus microplus TaxID=6941 RepID=UPI003F6D3C64
MGQGGSQVGTPKVLQGLSESDKGAIREAWRAFCNTHPDPGAVLFSALPDRHPEYQALFKEFRDVPRSGLVNVPFFKTHCSAMAKLLSDVVETLDKPALLAVVVRTNALEHATRDVLPLHFESLWQLVETRVGLGAAGTATAGASWEKLLEAMQEITLNVYENLGVDVSAPTASALSSIDESPIQSTRATPHQQVAETTSNVSGSKAGALEVVGPKPSVRKSGSLEPCTPMTGSTAVTRNPEPSTPAVAVSPKPSVPKVSIPNDTTSKPSSPTTNIALESCGRDRDGSSVNGAVDKTKDTGSEPSRRERKSKGNK